MKQCKGDCKEEKPLTEFKAVKRKGRKPTHDSYCKACRKKYNRTYYLMYNDQAKEKEV